MPDPNRPGDVPPDLPPEYAEAYRRGYERAYGAAPDDAPEQVGPRVTGPLFADEVEPQPVPRADPDATRQTGGAHRAEPADLAHGDEPRDRPAWLVPALLAGAVVVLLVGAYVVGRMVSDGLSSTDVADEEPDGVALSEDASIDAEPTESDEATKKPRAEKKYRGKVEAANVEGVTANCRYPSSVDSAGNKVSYGARNIADGDLTTAWRCAGPGDAEQLVIDLGRPTKIGEVGLIPGYAKTDPRSGVDRYAENNRLKGVSWGFGGDGGFYTSEQSFRQQFDTSPSNRSMQTMRIPVTTTRFVSIGVGNSAPGTRDTIAISEVRIGRVAD